MLGKRLPLPLEDPFDFEPELFRNFPPECQDKIEEIWGHIRTHYHIDCPCCDTYMMRLETGSFEEIKDLVHAALNRIRHKSKINVAFAYILQNKEDLTDFRVFYASTNTRIFEYPMWIGIYTDIDYVLEALNSALDIELLSEGVLPTSKWIIHSILSVTVFVYKSNIPLY